jgi:hypothetical protein
VAWHVVVTASEVIAGKWKMGNGKTGKSVKIAEAAMSGISTTPGLVE